MKNDPEAAAVTARGYVRLPLAVGFCKAQLVISLDIKSERIAALKHEKAWSRLGGLAAIWRACAYG